MIDIYKDTQDYFNMANIVTPHSKTVDITDIDVDVCVENLYVRDYITSIEVINCDTLDAAIKLKEEGYSPWY